MADIYIWPVKVIMNISNDSPLLIYSYYHFSGSCSSFIYAFFVDADLLDDRWFAGSKIACLPRHLI